MLNVQEKKERNRTASRRWRERNPERAREVSKLSKLRRPERIKEEWARWYENNREYVRKRDRERRAGNPENKIKYLLSIAKCRAKKRGIPFDVDIADLVIPTHCPLLGVELSYSNGRIHNTNSASIDRINSALGYVKGNVWIVSRRANCIKNDATIEELEMIVRNLKKKVENND